MNSELQNKTLEELQDAIIGSNVPQIVTSLISYALELGSSDIHVEPEEFTVRLRYRVDGILRQIIEYPPNLHSAIVARIKIMSNLKIDEQRIPQDGRTQVTTRDGRDMDLRVSTLPTVNGEKVVMRLQDKSRKIPTLEQLGIEGRNLEILKRSIESPNGIVLTTGPTGSGKTTTLYSCLSILNTIDVNIMTIEDPVEIQMDGLNQSQVHPAIGYTFAYGLRTALRQDPDIIMVGEIRDKETIEVGIEAALTGHLVLSTIHTNSAVATITRILNMGVPAFLITATLNAVVSQRLVRRVCTNCKKAVELAPDAEKLIRDTIRSMNPKEREKLGVTDDKAPLKTYEGAGCTECNGTGYKGRVGLYEILEFNNKIKTMILKEASNIELEKQAIADGMQTLEHAGVIQILNGTTTPEEVYAVARHGED
jgi:type IV pilus assembly protein PilB